MFNKVYKKDLFCCLFDSILRKLKQLNVDKQLNSEEKIKYLLFPCINDKSQIFASKIKTTVKYHFQIINLRIAFITPATLGRHFPIK